MFLDNDHLMTGLEILDVKGTSHWTTYIKRTFGTWDGGFVAVSSGEGRFVGGRGGIDSRGKELPRFLVTNEKSFIDGGLENEFDFDYGLLVVELITDIDTNQTKLDFHMIFHRLKMKILNRRAERILFLRRSILDTCLI